MDRQAYDNSSIERLVEREFGLSLRVTELVARSIATGYTSTATVFKATPTALYVLINAQGNLLLADVRKIIRHMNMEADAYMPPHGDADYFRRIGEGKFKALFPGKHIMSDEDTRYYRTLAVYNPALVRIAKVNGDIRSYHSESKSWRKVREYSYSKVTLVQ